MKFWVLIKMPHQKRSNPHTKNKLWYDIVVNLQKWHPDKNPDNTEEAKKQFQIVLQAYSGIEL